MQFLLLYFVCSKVRIGDSEPQTPSRAVFCRESRIHEPSKWSTSLRLLHHEVKPSLWWWESWSLTQRLTLTGFLLIVFPEEIAFVRLVVALLISIAGLMLVVVLRPYRKTNHQLLGVAVQLGLVCNFIGAILLKLHSDFKPVLPPLPNGTWLQLIMGFTSADQIAALMMSFSFGLIGATLIFVLGCAHLEQRRTGLASVRSTEHAPRFSRSAPQGPHSQPKGIALLQSRPPAATGRRRKDLSHSVSQDLLANALRVDWPQSIHTPPSPPPSPPSTPPSTELVVNSWGPMLKSIITFGPALKSKIKKGAASIPLSTASVRALVHPILGFETEGERRRASQGGGEDLLKYHLFISQ